MADGFPVPANHGELIAFPAQPERRYQLPRLPVELTRFIGRDREVAALAGLVREGARLVTLTGPGGVGKTRLALHVGRELADAFPDGVAFVPLETIQDPDHVPGAIARLFDLRDDELPPAERLVEALRDHRLLLLLDNVEQVTEAAPLIGALLAACPELALLVTSRIPLRLTGEQLFPVQPLGLPPAGARLDPGELAGAEAVALFVARAQGVRPAFALTDENAETVAEICRLVDGLPLAIELAAARIAHLTPAALLARLERQLLLLTGGARDRPERQQTMRATIAWSHDLLDEEERTLFRRLAVFEGGFTLEAAETVADGGTERRGDGQTDSNFPSSRRPVFPSVLDGIASLVEKSLLRQEEGLGGEARYRMLETVREFALEQLEATAEAETVRAAHAGWTVELATRLGVDVSARDDRDAIVRLNAEGANIRAVVGWLLENRQIEPLLRVIAALPMWLYYEGLSLRAKPLFAQALALDPEGRTALRAEALIGAGHVAHDSYDDETAHVWLNEGIAISREIGNLALEATGLALLGQITEDSGDAEQAASAMARAKELFVQVGDRVQAVNVTYHLGVIAFGRGALDQAERHFEEALQAARELGLVADEGYCLELLGLVACEQRNWRRAAEWLRRSAELGLLPILGHHRGRLLAAAAVFASATEQVEAAARLFAAAEVASVGRGLSAAWPEREVYARALGRLRVALGPERLTAAMAEGRAMTDDEATAEHERVLTEVVAGQTGVETESLTARERDVLRLLVEGKTNPEIADALFVSPRTVSTHVANIMAKLGVSTRTEAATRALRDGLI